jgi:hypothetical protein
MAIQAPLALMGSLYDLWAHKDWLYNLKVSAVFIRMLLYNFSRFEEL